MGAALGGSEAGKEKTQQLAGRIEWEGPRLGQETGEVKLILYLGDERFEIKRGRRE